MKNINKKNIHLSLIGFFLLGCSKKIDTQSSNLEIAHSAPKYQVKKSKIQIDYHSIQHILNKFKSSDQNKTIVELKNLLNKGPVVFIGILNGCPCNTKAQPIINNLSSKYKNKVTFVGLIPGKEKYLAQYSQRTKCAHPVILDEKLTLISALGMESSGFIALVEKKHQIVKVWPGYSKDILEELNKDLSYLTNQNYSAFDPQYAPSETTCGCPYTKNL